MFQEDLQADEDQDHTAAQLCLGLEAAAEHTAHAHANSREHKGGGGDQAGGREDLPLAHAQEGEAHAHRQGINAGGHSHGEHLFGAEGGVHLLLVIVPQRLPDHAAADEAEQHKGDPVVDAGDGRRKPHAQQPADSRHQALEAAEIQSGQQVMPEILLPAGQTLADGDGKGIHGKPYRNEKQLNQSHILLPLCII